MDASTILTLVQTVVQLIDSPATDSVWSFNYPLAELKETMCDINAWLKDAANIEKHQLGDMSETSRRQMRILQDLMYDVEDLLDEVNYVSQLKEVCLFFPPSYNHLVFANKMNRKMNKIRERLEGVKRNVNISQFLINIPHLSTGENKVSLRERVRQARMSTIHTSEIIGRDGDKKAVIELLSDANNVQQHLHFVTIVGFGGMGKTTLAKLICNDDNIKNEFGKHLSVCVSDTFCLESILHELLRQLGVDEGKLGINQIEQVFMQKIKGTKYLMLLDDVWSEDPNHWQKLKELLRGGEKGSKIVVTTRSIAVATIVGGKTYELKRLSPEDSWGLFKKIALGGEEEEGVNEEILEIGKHIVIKCGHVPLSIRVVAALLWNQDISKWQAIKHKTNITTSVNPLGRDTCGIIPILKLSYYDLDPEIRRCFSFFAMFPKDYVIEKETLIYLWIAHGWIVPEEGQSVDVVGEYYFMQLCQRGFIMENQAASWRIVQNWKMHDLMHDVAHDVAGAEMLVLSSNATQFPEGIRHASYYGRTVAKFLPDKVRKVRTIFNLEKHYEFDSPYIVDKMHFSKVKCLRVLHMPNLPFKHLPKSINKLIHLRFLDISHSQYLEVVPESLADLINLRVLFLDFCKNLKKLPRGMRKLVNLRVLNIRGCVNLRHMPPRMMNVTLKLTHFVVNETSHWLNYKQDQSSRLEDIEALTDIRNLLHIKVVCSKSASREVVYVLKDKLLYILRIEWDEKTFKDELEEDGAALLERLHPHPRLRQLFLTRYPGKKFEGWASSEKFETSLPHLVKLMIMDCRNLERLPSFSQLHLLKQLCIDRLDNLEYMEMSSRNNDGVLLFPVLEKIELCYLPKFKGWRVSTSRIGQLVEDQGSSSIQQQMFVFPIWAFPCICDFKVVGCPNLIFSPIAQNLVRVREVNAPGVSWGSSRNKSTWKIGSMEIDKLSYFNALPVECFQSLIEFTINGNDDISWPMVFSTNVFGSLQILRIQYCNKLKSLCGVGLEHLTNVGTLELRYLDELEQIGGNGNGMPWCSNLRHLEFCGLYKVRSMCGLGLEHLTNLQSLTLWDLDELEGMEDENGMPWKELHLQHLDFRHLPKMKKVPDGIQNLTYLRSLYFYGCENLESLPDWMTSLTHLESLNIIGCSLLNKRWKEPDGEDWPKIQHIPHIQLHQKWG